MSAFEKEEESIDCVGHHVESIEKLVSGFDMIYQRNLYEAMEEFYGRQRIILEHKIVIENYIRVFKSALRSDDEHYERFTREED